MPERNDADARSLRHAAEIGDRNAGHPVDRVEPIELERIDDEMKAVRQLLLYLGCIGFFGLYRCVSHGTLPELYVSLERALVVVFQSK